MRVLFAVVITAVAEARLNSSRSLLATAAAALVVAVAAGAAGV
jgi:hypothetical protein